MGRVLTSPSIFTELTLRRSLFLACLLFVLLPFQLLGADQPTPDFGASDIITNGQNLSSLQANEQHQRISALVSYLRSQFTSLVPGIQHMALAPNELMLNGMRGAASSLGLIDGERDTALSPFEQPSAALMQTPTHDAGEAVWLAPGYHHKGFLPFNDAMEMGVNLRHELFERTYRLEMHPYYGQNWVSERAYAGAEMALSLNHTIGFIQGGKISLNYRNGDSRLMDRGHGLELGSELQFADQLSLHAGVRQNETTEIGNYILIEWKLLTN